jgi:hypothetical protein
MALRDRPYPAFFGFAVLLFLATTLGSDVVARTTVGGEALGHAISEHAYYALVQPIGTALLIAPFLLLGWMSASLAKRKGFNGGLGVFFLGAFMLGVMYFSGYQDSQNYTRQKMWTAATLSIGLLPFKSVPLLLICLGFRWLVARKQNDAQT